MATELGGSKLSAVLRQGDLVRLENPHPRGGGKVFYATVVKSGDGRNEGRVGIVRSDWVQRAYSPSAPVAKSVSTLPPAERLTSEKANAARLQGVRKPEQKPKSDVRVFEALGFLRQQLPPAEFHRLLGENEAALDPILSPYGYRGSKVKSEAAVAEFDAVFTKWRQAQAQLEQGATAGRPSAPRRPGLQEMWATAAGDPIAAVNIALAVLISETAGRLFNFEIDPERAAAGATLISDTANLVGGAGVKEKLGRRPGGQMSGRRRDRRRRPLQTRSGSSPARPPKVQYRDWDRATVITTEVGPPQGRKGYERDLFPSVEVGLPGWERAHSQGAITGVEVRAGILYAHPKVNQELQRLGVEKTIQELYQHKPRGTRLILVTETIAYPGTRRLEEIRYRLTAVRGEEWEIKFEATIWQENKKDDPRVFGKPTFPTP